MLVTSPAISHFRPSVNRPGKRCSAFSLMRKRAQRGLVSGLRSHSQPVSKKAGTERPNGHTTWLAIIHAGNTLKTGVGLVGIIHAVRRPRHGQGAQWGLQVWREWAKAAPEPGWGCVAVLGA